MYRMAGCFSLSETNLAMPTAGTLYTTSAIGRTKRANQKSQQSAMCRHECMPCAGHVPLARQNRADPATINKPHSTQVHTSSVSQTHATNTLLVVGMAPLAGPSLIMWGDPMHAHCNRKPQTCTTVESQHHRKTGPQLRNMCYRQQGPIGPCWPNPACRKPRFTESMLTPFSCSSAASCTRECRHTLHPGGFKQNNQVALGLCNSR
jgi:hypothetical protein